MTSFNSASFPDSLAIAKESGLSIGSIDEIQKLHIRAVPVGEQARRLAHQELSHTFLLTTSSEPSGTVFVPSFLESACLLVRIRPRVTYCKGSQLPPCQSFSGNVGFAYSGKRGVCI